MNVRKPIHFDHFFRTTQEGEKVTHVQFFPYKELKYNETKDDKEKEKNVKDEAGNVEHDFYMDYCDKTEHLVRHENDTQFPKLGEVYEGIVPLVVRVKLVLNGEFDVIQSDEFLMGIVRESQHCIERLFELSEPTKEHNLHPELVACLLEGWHYFFAGESISKARIQFPLCRVPHIDVLEKFYPMLIERLVEKNVLQLLSEDIRANLKIGWHEIIDINAMQAPLPLYYSVEDNMDAPLMLTHIFPKLPEKLEEHEDTDDINIFNCFNPEYHVFFKEIYKEEEHGTLINLYPLFFSIHYGDWTTPSIPENEILTKTPMPANRDEVRKGSLGRGKYLDIAKTIIEILKTDPQVIQDYKEVIGKSIYGSDQLDNNRATKEGEALFLDMKMFVENEEFKMRKSRNEYKDMRSFPVSYTYKTLCYILKTNMPEEFTRWHERWCQDALLDALKSLKETLRFAEVIYRMFFLEFIVSEYSKNTWFQFDGNVWRENDKSVEIRKKIIENFRYYMEKRINVYRRERDKSDDDRKKKDIQIDIEALETLQYRISTMKGLNDLMSHLTIMFYDKNFIRNKNKNIYVTGVRNGVMEAKDTHLFFRSGLPEDYITKQCDAFYEKHSEEHPDRKFLMDYFYQMWPKDTVSFILKYKASYFIGKNFKAFLFLVGAPNSSKTLFNKLDSSTWGEYYVEMEAAAFTKRKQSSSNSTPEWEDARDARSLVVNEPGEDMFSDLLKKISGNDGLRSRNHFEKGSHMTSTFKIMAIMNESIGLEPEPAIKNRFRLIECTAQYRDTNIPKTEDEQRRKRIYKLDENFDEKILRYRNAYLSILKDYYALYKKEGLEVPKEMQKSMDRYWANYDLVSKFVNEFVEKYDVNKEPLPETSTLFVDDLYHLFEGWYSSMRNNRIYNNNKFRYILSHNVAMNEDKTMCLGVKLKKGIQSAQGLEGLI